MVYCFFFFLYIMYHNIILFNSVAQYSLSHALIYSHTHSLGHSLTHKKYLTKQARVSSPQALQYFCHSFTFPFLSPQ